jgi:hypothetical protein
MALTIFGLDQIGYWAVIAEDIDKPLDSVRASWDREVSVGVAARPQPGGARRMASRRRAVPIAAGAQELPRRLARHRTPGLRALRESYPFPNRPVVDAAGRRPYQMD